VAGTSSAQRKNQKRIQGRIKSAIKRFLFDIVKWGDDGHGRNFEKSAAIAGGAGNNDSDLAGRNRDCFLRQSLYQFIQRIKGKVPCAATQGT